MLVGFDNGGVGTFSQNAYRLVRLVRIRSITSYYRGNGRSLRSVTAPGLSEWAISHIVSAKRHRSIHVINNGTYEVHCSSHMAVCQVKEAVAR